MQAHIDKRNGQGWNKIARKGGATCLKQSSQPNPQKHKTTTQTRTGSNQCELVLISDLPNEVAVTEAELALVEGFMQDVIDEIMILGV